MRTTRKPGLLLALLALSAAIALVGAITWALLDNSSDDGTPALQPPLTPTAAQPPAGTPTSTSTPDIGARPLTVGPDLEFPPDTEILFVLGPFGKDGGPFSLQRAYRIGDGPVELDVLFPPEAVEGDGYAGNIGAAVSPTGFAVHPTRHTLVAVCYGEGCGYVGGTGGLPARTVFYESADGGLSWATILERDGRWWPRGFHRQQLLALDFDAAEPRGILVPSGETFTWPQGLSPWPGAPLFPGGDIRYSDSQGDRIVNEVPAVEFRPDVPIEFRLTMVHPLKDHVLFAAAFIEDFDEEAYDPSKRFPGQRSFLGLFGPKGVVRHLYELPPGTAATGFAGLLDTDRNLALGTFSYSDRPATCTSGGTSPGSAPALFDTETGVVQFIPYPFLDPACPGGSHIVVAFRQGDLARVETPGDCLNLRERPDPASPVITCLPHATIVRNQGTVWQDEWTDVRLFDGTQGWASLAYLDKGPPRSPSLPP